LRTFFLLLLILVLLAGGYVAYVAEAPAGPSAQTFVTIAPGTATAALARQLQDHGIIRSRWVFLAMHELRGGTLKAGMYRFDHPAPMAEVYQRLRHGDVYTVSVTIPEGANIFDIAARLDAAQLASRNAFLAVAQHDTPLIADLDPQAPSLEGYLFPDTYKFTPQTDPAEIAAVMVKRFRAAAARLGLNTAPGVAGERQPSAPPPPSIHQIVTIASLVERETPIPDERPLVASVFYNRLAKGMPLMTDPSVIYAALLENRYRGTIYASDLASESPYNTYKHAGLPPGPICNPGLASLQAAMHPAKTDYLYFVAASADPSGHSRFSATLEEHARDVEAYRRAVKQSQSR
jgi:UPF0755 protein